MTNSIQHYNRGQPLVGTLELFYEPGQDTNFWHFNQDVPDDYIFVYSTNGELMGLSHADINPFAGVHNLDDGDTLLVFQKNASGLQALDERDREELLEHGTDALVDSSYAKQFLFGMRHLKLDYEVNKQDLSLDENLKAVFDANGLTIPPGTFVQRIDNYTVDGIPHEQISPELWLKVHIDRHPAVLIKNRPARDLN